MRPADVTDSQFMYIDSQVSYADNDGPAPARTHERQVWLAVADQCAGGLLIENGQRFDLGGFTPAEAPKGSCPERGHLASPTYRLLQSLPTDPHTLLALITRIKHGGGQFTAVGDLLRESITPPWLSAALYRAAALIPGVTLVPAVTDAIGRSGVAVSFTSDGVQNEWIFDPHTFQFLGERQFINGTLTGKSAIITRAFVDHAGELPAGS